MRRARRIQGRPWRGLHAAAEAADLANPSRQGQRNNFVDNRSDGVNEVERPTGNSAAAAMRRLRKDRPDIHSE
jgi:hypothetical protein